MAAIRLGIKNANDIMTAFGIVNLTMIGEPEPAMCVEYDIVRSTQAAPKVA